MPRLNNAGVTLIDALLAMTVLSIVVLGITYATTAGHAQLQQGEATLRAVRLAEQLLEEVIARPYDGTGGSDRADWHIDQFDEFEEEFDELSDFRGAHYGGESLGYRRSVVVEPTTRTVAALDGIEIAGKDFVVTVEDERGQRWQLRRFVPEPEAPHE